MFVYGLFVRTKVVLAALIVGLLVVLLACGGSPTAATGTNPTLAPAETATNASPASDTPAATAPAQSALPTATPEATLVQATAPSPTAPPGTTAPPSGGNAALDIILDAMRAQMTAKTFRSVNISTASDGKVTTITTEYVAPDRIHMVTQMSNGATSEQIAVKGKGTWQLVKGKWTKSAFDLSTIAFEFLDPKNLDEMRKGIDIGQIQLVGADLLDGKPMLVYQYNLDINSTETGGSVIKGTSKIWIGATDSRAYKIEGDTDSLINKGKKVHSLITYEYDVPITIEVPA